jgi:hypothetical protein
MTTTDGFEWPQNDPLFEVSLDAIAEGLDGNGVLASGDLQVTATANANEIQVAAGDLWYAGSVYSLGAAETHVLTDGDATDDRWDSVVFDTGGGFSNVLEGNAEANPEPPSPGAGQVLLAYIYVASGETDVTDSEIKNFRAFSTDAADVRLDDSAGDYSSSHVEAALTEVIREAGDPLNGPLDLSGFSGTAPFDLGTNPGAFGAIVDAVVDSNSAAGTEHSFLFAVDSSTLVKVYAESDGAGGVQNLRIEVPVTLQVGDDIVTAGGTTVWDSTNGYVPAGSVQTIPLGSGTDRDLSGNNLQDSSGPGTLYDATAGEFPRGVLDDERATTVVTTSTYTTSDERVILVDTATIGASSTITIASADVEQGHEFVVVDLSGSASSHSITIDTEGSETIDGGSSVTIDSNHGSRRFETDGNNIVTSGGGGGGGGGQISVEDDGTAVGDFDTLDFGANLSTTDNGDGSVTADASGGSGGLGNDDVQVDNSGDVPAGETGVLWMSSVPDGQTLSVTQGGLISGDGTAAPSDFDLIIVTFDNSGGANKRGTIIAGDGAVKDDLTGSPLASYSNSSGGAKTVAIVVDNGNFNTGTGSSQSFMASTIGSIA